MSWRNIQIKHCGKFDIKESPLNKIFEGESFSKKICSQNFSYQPGLLLLDAGIKCFDILDIDYVTIVIFICSH